MNTRTTRRRKRNFESDATIDLTQENPVSVSTQIQPSINGMFSTPAAVVSLSDSSIIEIPSSPLQSTSEHKPQVSKKPITAKKMKMAKKTTKETPAPERAPRSTLGECPICLDEVGTNGDVIWSTKCGHLFCCVCLMQTMEHNPNCPTCRGDLRGPGSHHPLYPYTLTHA